MTSPSAPPPEELAEKEQGAALDVGASQIGSAVGPIVRRAGHTCCQCTKQPTPLPCCNPGHYKTAEDCPAVATHTPHPSGYLAHADWADEKLKTHVQRRCPTCHYWAIWERRPAPKSAVVEPLELP